MKAVSKRMYAAVLALVVSLGLMTPALALAAPAAEGEKQGFLAGLGIDPLIAGVVVGAIILVIIIVFIAKGYIAEMKKK